MREKPNYLQDYKGTDTHTDTQTNCYNPPYPSSKGQLKLFKGSFICYKLKMKFFLLVMRCSSPLSTPFGYTSACIGSGYCPSWYEPV